MKKLIGWQLLLVLVISGCNQPTIAPLPDSKANTMPANLINENLTDLNWLHEPATFSVTDQVLTVAVAEGTDFFNNPEDSSVTATAPLLYKEISGDFVATSLVRPDFSSMWNAVCMMVHIDSLNWIKFAFENSDATGPSIVSVVTKQISDDANGAILNDQKEIWLKLVRKSNNYSMLWSLDGKDYKMARLTSLPPTPAVKIGVEAQCPVGPSARHEILYFNIEKKTVKDLRTGE
jgi:regulation of enolase protein 1 (concanavalin A-like superfamily)